MSAGFVGAQLSISVLTTVVPPGSTRDGVRPAATRSSVRFSTLTLTVTLSSLGIGSGVSDDAVTGNATVPASGGRMIATVKNAGRFGWAVGGRSPAVQTT